MDYAIPFKLLKTKFSRILILHEVTFKHNKKDYVKVLELEKTQSNMLQMELYIKCYRYNLVYQTYKTFNS